MSICDKSETNRLRYRAAICWAACVDAARFSRPFFYRVLERPLRRALSRGFYNDRDGATRCGRVFLRSKRGLNVRQLHRVVACACAAMLLGAVSSAQAGLLANSRAWRGGSTRSCVWRRCRLDRQEPSPCMRARGRRSHQWRSGARAVSATVSRAHCVVSRMRRLQVAARVGRDEDGVVGVAGLCCVLASCGASAAGGAEQRCIFAAACARLTLHRHKPSTSSLPHPPSHPRTPAPPPLQHTWSNQSAYRLLCEFVLFVSVCFYYLQGAILLIAMSVAV